MAEPAPPHALGGMLAGGPPDTLAPQSPPRERQRGISDERREHRRREPERPGFVAPADDAERGGEKTERDRADVAEKDARRMKVEDEESAARRRNAQAGGGELGPVRQPRPDRVGGQ